MRHRRPWPAGAAVPALAAALVGCGASGAASAHSATPTQCGTARTAANVRVLIEISHGPVTCSTALTVEQAYAAAVAAGQAPGNGGGGPVSVNGWTCLRVDTPPVLRTRQGSQGTKDGPEIPA